MKFDKFQSLGGHMNRHREKREQENLQRARDLVTNREQHYGATTWNMQGAGAGTLRHGENLSPDSPAVVGGFSRPHFAPNQSAVALQNWQMAQLSSPRQSSTYSLRSAPLVSGGSYYDVHQQDTARPHPGLPAQAIGVHLPAHQQLRVNTGQHNMVQQMVYSELEPVLQRGVDIAGRQQSAYHLNQAGPSIGRHLDIVLGHYTSYDQELGTSVMGSIVTYNQAAGSGSRHMPRFQDSTGDRENYRRGNDQSAPVAEAGLEGSPDISSDDKSQH